MCPSYTLCCLCKSASQYAPPHPQCAFCVSQSVSLAPTYTMCFLWKSVSPSVCPLHVSQFVPLYTVWLLHKSVSPCAATDAHPLLLFGLFIDVCSLTLYCCIHSFRKVPLLLSCHVMSFCEWTTSRGGIVTSWCYIGRTSCLHHFIIIYWKRYILVHLGLYNTVVKSKF